MAASGGGLALADTSRKIGEGNANTTPLWDLEWMHRSARSTAKRSRRNRRGKTDDEAEDDCEDADTLNMLPDEVIRQGVVAQLEAEDLGRLSCVNQLFRSYVQSVEGVWKRHYLQTWGMKNAERGKQINGVNWGEGNPLLERASELAGGWQKLFSMKRSVCTSERPWLLPAQPEVDAILEDMASNAQVGRDFVTLFLLDGSGSVTGEDFSTMTGFLMPAIRKIDTMTGGSGKYGVLQFSNETRLEILPSPACTENLIESIDSIKRMNGGTNIASPLRHVKAMLSNGHEECDCVVAILTDGRLDSYQTNDAISQAKELGSSVASLSIYAFGVGRGAEYAELMRLILNGTKGPDTTTPLLLGRCFPLRTTNETLW